MVENGSLYIGYLSINPILPNDVGYQAAPHTDIQLRPLIHSCPARKKLAECTESNDYYNQNSD